MQVFEEYIRKELKETKEMLQKIRWFKEDMPKGSLVIVKQDGIPYYKWQYRDENLTCVRKYISKKEMDKIKSLAQKGFYEKVEPILQKNLKLLEKFDTSYSYDHGMQIYESLTQDRQSLIIPLEENCVQRIQNWQKEEYQQCNKYPETLRYETNAGEFVRSKSEVIIADLLYAQADRLLYKYERPLTLKHNGRDVLIYPDFTILNTQTGKITYWEHAGLMSKAEYASDFVWKNNLYYSNNLLPGIDVQFTFETEEHPLEMRLIKNIISNL